MKWKILFAILAVMMLAGCAKQAVEEETSAPVTEVPEEPVVEEIVEEPVVEAPEPTTETVLLSDDAADPSDLAVVAGSTIIFKNTGTKVKILQVKKVEFNERSPRLESGDVWEITLPDAGEYQFLDIIIGKAKGTITAE